MAVYRGTADQLAFDRALQTVGLNERSMQVINLDWSAGKAALAAGRVDAVWGGVSLLALRGDKIAVVVKSGDSGRQTPPGGLPRDPDLYYGLAAGHPADYRRAGEERR
ncbi:ABC-type taurine transport system, periplasmic component [Raoultella terrigena]|uniref:ABC-type taurine transport system, periplasmic component n=1 Tax=Raoultella terrigena TaxID=577 RepID=A0A485B1F2_RAOTE|nr:ABC-type taurine transport system, periplasmic component [Raoultella terrigena]